MRWQTADPLGFADGLNQYAYAHNNPFPYRDLDGRFAWALSFAFLEGSFGCAGLAVACPLLIPACAITAGVTFGCAAVYYAQDYRLKSAMLENDFEQKTENIETDKPKDKFKDKEPPRTKPKNLEEQLAIEEAKNDREDRQIMKDKINDPKYPKDTWAKRQHVHKPLDSKADEINIHYWEYLPTGERHGFKFKD